MNINNKEFTDPYGNDQVDTVGYNPSLAKDYLQQEHNSLGAPVDGSSPSLDPQPYYPDGGTILSEEYFNYSNSGVASVASYSVNTVEQDEQRMRQIDLEATQGRSIYNAPPKSSGAPSINDGEKLNSTQLEKQIKENNINNLIYKLSLLTREKESLEIRLINTERAIKNTKNELETI